jgi:hypothetical protein
VDVSDPSLPEATQLSAPSAEDQVREQETMLPRRSARPRLESALVRVIATCGVVAIGVAIGAILISQSVAGWITGLVVSLVSVILSAILWSSQRL